MVTREGKAANPFHSLAALQKLALHASFRTAPSVAFPRFHQLDTCRLDVSSIFRYFQLPTVNGDAAEMNPPTQQPIDPEDEPPLDPIVYKAHLYQTLSRLWFFPSIGAIVILGNSVTKGSLKGIIDSQRLEDIAAAAVLLGHCFFFIQSKRFHQLKQTHESASLRH
jgi:hypothetical protein